ncbi:HAMP domain-containing protein [Clostridium sp. YIM B02505]|uniref:histidine kinase n=1 Tax=Clostridium yunnanense TaxID=2800325 RepID=A0ABS1EIW4_9CLOT|nr:HAMP domain-containing sensor histidine kinase [Clostridium yunnanense]MBK1809297.1 HAMP domain-containing protein [Clostridium yunnanense]
MKQSISKRIFIITFGLIVGLMVFAALFQMFFFERFYTDKKTKLLIANVESFKTSYSGTTNKNAILNGLNILQYSTSALVGLYSLNGSAIYGSEQSIDVTSSIYNSLINPDNISDIFTSGKTLSQVYDDKKHNIKHIVVITPMSFNTKNDSILITVFSFQGIKEASSIIGQFYKYIFVALIFIGLILSFIYSDLISKPLKRLNKVARKMSSMDFTEKCISDREDEIGDLAKTLNFLSENLSNALDDLRSKNKELQADIEKERKLEKIRKDFIAGVSHELKTPIGIIEGYAEGLKDNIVDGEAKDIYLDIIIDESNKMNKLVMDMLELSRLEADSNKLQISSFDIVSLTNEILFKYSNNFTEKNLKINKSYSAENIIMVVGDEFKIESVITNFLTNAIKYTNENESINIFIGVDNTKALFSIENTGAFLKKDDLEKVWVQFYRVDKARSRSEGSSGLGLAIVKQMLTQHNSTFGVRNTSNGVEFFFDLNLSNSSTAQTEQIIDHL